VLAMVKWRMTLFAQAVGQGVHFLPYFLTFCSATFCVLQSSILVALRPSIHLWNAYWIDGVTIILPFQLQLLLSTNFSPPHATAHFPFSPVVKMSQPLTSKIAVVAQCMDEFVRRENNALSLAYEVAQSTAEFRLIQLQSARDLHSHLHRRIQELEDDLRESEEALRVSNDLCNTLEISILECEHHRAAAATSRELTRLFQGFPPPDNYEIVDLTTDSESE